MHLVVVTGRLLRKILLLRVVGIATGASVSRRQRRQLTVDLLCRLCVLLRRVRNVINVVVIEETTRRG